MRFLVAISAGYAAFALAVGVGIPIWLDWPTMAVPADATDIGVLVAFAVWHWRTTPTKPTPDKRATGAEEDV